MMFPIYDSWISPLLKDDTTRGLFWFACINMVFTFFEVVTGWSCGSLSLLGDGLHMLLDAVVLFANLFVVILSKWPPTVVFPFGFSRTETVAGFVNALILIFISFSVAVEALNRFSKPPVIQTTTVMIVSFLGLVVNLIGLYAFNNSPLMHHHHHQARPRPQLRDHNDNLHACSQPENGHFHNHISALSNSSLAVRCKPALFSADKKRKSQDLESGKTSNAHTLSYNMIFQGMFLHVLADTLGSIVVLLSTWLIKNTGYYWIDPISSFILSILIIVATWPLLKSSFYILMQASQFPSSEAKHKILADISSHAEVSSVSSLKIWQLKENQYIASVALTLSEFSIDAYSRIHEKIKQCLKEYEIDQFTIELGNHQIKS